MHADAVDGSKLKALGWTQATPFLAGLRQTIAWYRTYGETYWGDITALLSPFPIADTQTGSLVPARRPAFSRVSSAVPLLVEPARAS